MTSIVSLLLGSTKGQFGVERTQQVFVKALKQLLAVFLPFGHME